MAQIRHLAIRTENPEQLAAFYMEAFGLKEFHRGSHPGLPGGKTVHFGILVDNMDETLQTE